MARHSMMTAEIRKAIPDLYAQDGKGRDAVAYAHYFSPWNGWDWYATEFDGKDTFFGLVRGFETELGYFSLRELSETTVTLNGHTINAIERDTLWTPRKLSDLEV